MKKTPVLWLLILLSLGVKAQETKGFYKIGFVYGLGSNENFLFDDPDYSYSVDIFKVEGGYRLHSGTFAFDLLLQAEYNQTQHQLLNRWFVDTDADRERFMPQKTIKEYILGPAFQVRKDISELLSFFATGGVSLGYLDRATERLPRGLAFVDHFSIGASVALHEGFRLELQPQLRHISNANLRKPNSGYNSLNILIGLSYNFGGSQKIKNRNR